MAAKKNMLLGVWRMHSDSNMTLVFTADSVKLLMSHKEIQGYEATYILSDKSCDNKAYGDKPGLFLQETYSFTHSRQPHTMKACSQIAELTSGRLVIKDSGVTVVYDKTKR